MKEEDFNNIIKEDINDTITYSSSYISNSERSILSGFNEITSTTIRSNLSKSLSDRKVSFSAVISVYEYKYMNNDDPTPKTITECIYEEDIDCNSSLTELNLFKNMEYYEPFDKKSFMKIANIDNWNVNCEENYEIKTVKKSVLRKDSISNTSLDSEKPLSKESCCQSQCTIF